MSLTSQSENSRMFLVTNRTRSATAHSIAKATEERRNADYKTLFVRTGTSHISIGVLSIVFDIVTMVFYASSNTAWSKIGTGVWCGIYFIFCGISSIYAGRKRTYCTIAFAVCATLISILFSVAGLIIEVNILRYHIPHKAVKTSYMALHSMTLIFCVLALLAAVVELILFVIASCRPSVNVTNTADYNNASQTQIVEGSSKIFSLDESTALPTDYDPPIDHVRLHTVAYHQPRTGYTGYHNPNITISTNGFYNNTVTS